MRLITLHDVLTAWQDGTIGYRRAIELAQVDTLGELYDAARASDVALNTKLSPIEEETAQTIGRLIKSQMQAQPV